MAQPKPSPPAIRPLSPSLYVIEDTCNVYLVCREGAGLLIDSGSGAAAALMVQAGANTLEWILHTHYHRDQCWGTSRLTTETDARVAVPEYERYYFSSAQEHWQTRRVYQSYGDYQNSFLIPTSDIAVSASLEDYETFVWRDIEFFVLPAQGHSYGSSALLAEIDGRMVAFTGDLLMAGGYLYQLHALEYGYGDMAGVPFTLQSLDALRKYDPEILLPSHGPLIEEVRPDLDRLEQRLMDIVRLGAGIEVTGRIDLGPAPTRYLPKPQLIAISEHLLWSGPWTCSNFYVLLSDSGEALFIDYGHALWPNYFGPDLGSQDAERFIVHHLDELSERFGVSSIEVVVVTHVHNDHTCGVPYLQRHCETECWALDTVAQVLEHPAKWASVPCILSKPIQVSRALADGECVGWRGFDLQFHLAPGQTEWHSVISCEVDGRTVAFTGDNYFLAEVEVAGQMKLRPFQTTVFGNGFQLEMHRRCVDVMRALSPDLICPGHGEVLNCDAGMIGDYANYVAEKERVFRNAVLEPTDHYADLFWARLRPYFATVEGGGRLEYTLMLRNNLGRTATYEARLLPPLGWDASKVPDAIELPAGGSGELTLTMSAPAEITATEIRAMVTAEVLIDGVSQGPIAEALVTGAS